MRAHQVQSARKEPVCTRRSRGPWDEHSRGAIQSGSEHVPTHGSNPSPSSKPCAGSSVTIDILGCPRTLFASRVCGRIFRSNKNRPELCVRAHRPRLGGRSAQRNGWPCRWEASAPATLPCLAWARPVRGNPRGLGCSESRTPCRGLAWRDGCGRKPPRKGGRLRASSGSRQWAVSYRREPPRSCPPESRCPSDLGRCRTSACDSQSIR